MLKRLVQSLRQNNGSDLDMIGRPARSVAFSSTLLLSVVLTLSVPVLSTSPAWAEGFGQTQRDNPSTPKNKPCRAARAPLTNNFAEDPCELTRDKKNLKFAQEHQAGWRFIKHVGDWWEEKFLPDLKAMTKQMRAGMINQTLLFGKMIDAQYIGSKTRMLQSIEVDARKSMTPNENTCVAGTHQLALGSTLKISNTIAKSFAYEESARSAGMRLPGEVERLQKIVDANFEKNKSRLFPNAVAAPKVPKVVSPAGDQLERFKTYCKYFRDPESNNGEWDDVCPDDDLSADQIWDADIDVEDFLLKATIDMNKPEERAAALALMQNLLEPRIMERLPDGGTNEDGVLKRTEGQEFILQKQHLASVRKLASSVVGSIISRRISIPGTNEVFDVQVTTPGGSGGNSGSGDNGAGSGTGGTGSGTGGGGSTAGLPASCQAAQNTVKGHAGTSTYGGTMGPLTVPEDGKACGSYEKFFEMLGHRESSGVYTATNSLGYMGKYQMGGDTLRDLCKVGKDFCYVSDITGKGNKVQFNGRDGINSLNAFLANKQVQEKLIRAKMQLEMRYLKNLGLLKYVGQKTPQGIPVTVSGLLGAAHLMGSGGVACFFNNNTNSWCPKKASRYTNGIIVDGTGTPVTQYMNLFGGYETPFDKPWGSPNGGVTPGGSGGAPAGDTGGGDTGGGSTGGTTSTQSVNVSSTIQDIRSKAGVDKTEIAEFPSYNEIMIAMTKERFFNPDYYTRMANDVGALRQEQTVVNSYIAIQLQDIYRLQEQINLMMAAKAAMKLNEKPMPNLIEKLPTSDKK